MSKKVLLSIATVLITGLLCAGASASRSQQQSRHMMVGVYDDTMSLGIPQTGFPLMKTVRAQVVRITLWWGGSAIAVAKRRPVKPTDPNDPAYDWFVYDRAVQYAQQNNVKVLFAILGTPGWANKHRRSRYAPTNFKDLQNFATAAARRYSGTFKATPDSTDALPAVHLWLAWNEPNNPVFLAPQYRKVHKKWIVNSAYQYVRICNAIFNGVHAVQHRAAKVACGATDPFGNNRPGGKRPSVAPLTFLAAVKKYGLRHFDAWAHHPYAGRPSEKPTTKPKTKTSVSLGNLGDLNKALVRLYGNKRIWITEYGYQTRPPDRIFGVSWKNQAKYMAQAFAIARKNPRVDMMVWYLLRDEQRLSGWQSGLLTLGGKKKPSYNTFRTLKH
jgi:hypothetical protein